MGVLALGAAIGAAFAFFFDPQSGRRRRTMTRDRALGLVRGAGRRGEQVGRAAAAETYGMAQKATHVRETPKEYDDVTLARKVETEIFRDADAPKGKIDVNVVDGVVELRGEADTPEMIDDLVAKTRKVQGVRDVENLLHLPNAPAPMHE